MNRLKIISPLLLFLAAAPGVVQRADVKSELVRVETDDGVTLDGALWSPASGKARVGVVLATGTGGEFYSQGWFGDRYAQAGYLALSLNRRDHGQNFGYRKLEPSALDHRYAVDLLVSRGVERVILAGHSYGTVTVPYYVMASDDSRVKGMILTSALGDLRTGTRIAVGGQAKYDEMVAKARQMVQADRGQETLLMAPLTSGSRPTMHNYEIFLDKRGPDSKAVPYQVLSKIENRPILAIRDPADPFPATLPPAQQQLDQGPSMVQSSAPLISTIRASPGYPQW